MQGSQRCDCSLLCTFTAAEEEERQALGAGRGWTSTPLEDELRLPSEGRRAGTEGLEFPEPGRAFKTLPTCPGRPLCARPCAQGSAMQQPEGQGSERERWTRRRPTAGRAAGAGCGLSHLALEPTNRLAASSGPAEGPEVSPQVQILSGTGHRRTIPSLVLALILLLMRPVMELALGVSTPANCQIRKCESVSCSILSDSL